MLASSWVDVTQGDDRWSSSRRHRGLDDNEVLPNRQSHWHGFGGPWDSGRDVAGSRRMTWGRRAARSGTVGTLRTVSDELAHRYRSTGWWNDDTLGELVAPGTGTGWAPRRSGCDRRCIPGTGTLRRRRSLGPGAGRGAAGRGGRTGRRGGLPAAQLGGGGDHLLGRVLPGCGGRPDRPLLRGQGGRLHPPHRVARRGGHRRPLRSQRLPDHLRGSAVGERRPAGWWSREPPDPERELPPGARPFDLAARGRSRPRSRPGRSGHAGHHRLHLGDHPRPEGGDPLPPDHRVRDAPARLHVPHAVGRPRSPGPRSATSSGCSTPS